MKGWRVGVKVIAIVSDLRRKAAEVVWKQEINCLAVFRQSEPEPACAFVHVCLPVYVSQR